MKLWKADLSVQFLYGYGGGDDFLNCMIFKGLMDNGWIWHNRFLGAPFGLDMHDYPCADNLSLFLMKVLFFWSSNYSLGVNFYFLLTFPLTTLTSLFVFRQFNISYLSAVVGSLLYAFLPYHFFHGIMHLQLISYYMIPLVVGVLLWICRGDPLFSYEVNDKKKRGWITYKGWIAILVCICIGFGTVYYSFFSGFLLLIAGLSTFFRRREYRQALTSLILLTLLFLSCFINLSPNFIYVLENGKNFHVANWDFSASEILGMKITHLLLPINGHRIFKLNEMKWEYNNIAPLLNESSWSSLGIVGGLGFLLLLFWLLRKNSKDPDCVLLDSLSILNVSAVILGTIGGFGSLFALLFLPTIRAYNRVSIFIAFFSFFALVLILDRLKFRLTHFRFEGSLYSLLLCSILIFGILDQTTSGFPFVPPYEKSKAEYDSDARFVKKIETLMPNDAMIFQLPYFPFPDSPNMDRMLIFDPLRVYLHSRTLCWSYGAMKGRQGDAWQREVAANPLEKIVEVLAFAGFKGIYLDRFGYPDSGREIEERLSQLLKTEPIVSENKRLVFFNMTSFNGMLKEVYTIEEWEIKRREIFPSLL